MRLNTKGCGDKKILVKGLSRGFQNRRLPVSSQSQFKQKVGWKSFLILQRNENNCFLTILTNSNISVRHNAADFWGKKNLRRILKIFRIWRQKFWRICIHSKCRKSRQLLNNDLTAPGLMVQSILALPYAIVVSKLKVLKQQASSCQGHHCCLF